MVRTFQERQKAEYIYKTYFDPESEHVLDFNLFDTLGYYAEAEKETNKIEKLLKKVENKLLEEINLFDRVQLGRIKK